MPKFIECEQGDELWYKSRAGLITSSNVAKARQLELKSGPNKGQPGSDCLAYAFAIAIERIAGEPLQGKKFETYAMRRGHELEPEARRCHERLGVVVHRVGFCIGDDGWNGTSTDGLIGERDAAEYKCLTDPKELRAILVDDDLESFQDQCQHGLWVAKRERMHFGLYCPALAPIGREFTLRMVYRDDVYIKAMERDLRVFRSMVEDFEGALRNGTEQERLYLAKELA